MKTINRIFCSLLLAGACAAVPFLIFHFALPDGQWMDFITYFFTLFAAVTLAPFLFKKLKI